MGLAARHYSMDKYLANYYLVLFQWILCICIVATKKYDMRELCDVQEGSVRISLDQGSYVELDLSVNLEGPGTNCEIIIQTTHRGDGLLLYYENFDFVGSNFATVFRREDCGNTILKAWDGEFHYLSSCIGSGLEAAPPMTTFSSLGAVRLQLMPTNLTGADGQKEIGIASNSSRETPIQFSIIATASQKASFTKDCPSGCCNEPYTFRCPLLNQCIDMKLTCNNITNCGPRVGPPRDENGLMCQEGSEQITDGAVLHHILGPADIQRVVTADDPDDQSRESATPARNTVGGGEMLRPLWSHDTSNSIFGDIGNVDVQQAYYTRIELVCGIASIAFFCLAGIAVLVCKSRHSHSFGAYIDRRQASAAYIASDERRNPTSGYSGEDGRDGNVISVILARSQSMSDLSRPVEGNDNEASIAHYMAARPKPRTCHCSAAGSSRDVNSAGIYTIDIEGGNFSHYCSCNEHPPPPYESLYPK